MTANVQISLATADVTVLALLSVGVMAAIVWSSVRESRRAGRRRRRLESKRQKLAEQLSCPVIDGLTEDFNLQADWTTGWLAGQALARKSAKAGLTLGSDSGKELQ